MPQQTKSDGDVVVAGIYRGWWTVAAASLGLFLSFGAIVPYTFGVFALPLGREFGWTAEQIPLAFTIVSLTALLNMPVVGRLVDRYGARRVVLVYTALFGCGLIALAFLTSRLWHFYLNFFFLGVVAVGTSAVGYSSVVARWFDRRRGLALGLTMAGVGAGAFVLPVVAERLISRVGWRATYLALGAAVLVVSVPVLWLLLKEPERASEEGGANAAARATTIVAGLTRGEAVRTRTFWIMLVSFSLVSMCAQAGLIHLPRMLTDRGVTERAAAIAVSVLGGASLAGRLLTGFFVDRFRAARVAAVCFTVAAAGFGLLLVAPNEFALPGGLLAALLIGYGYGAETDIIPYLISRHYGFRAFGEVYTYLFVTVPLGGVIGPALAGALYRRAGDSYVVPLALCLTLTLCAALLISRLGKHKFVDETAPAAQAAPHVSSTAPAADFH